MGIGYLKIREDKCKGCGLCIAACPKKILEIDMEKVNVKDYRPIKCINMDECIGCGNCGIMCPDGVINIYREK